jgi:hypothetical protein
MNILEKEIEDLVWSADWDLIRERGLPISGRGFRQLNLGSYGISDIVTFDLVKTRYTDRKETSRHLTVSIYELKKDNITIDTLLQAIRYYKAIQRIIETSPYLIDAVDYEIYLIGKGLDKNGDGFSFITDFCPSINFYTYSIDLVNGLRFKRQDDYRHVNEVLPKIDSYSFEDIFADQRTRIV